MTEGSALGVDFDQPQRVHVVAIGGAAMSGIARYLRECGHEVSGSEVRSSSTTQALQHEGIDVAIGHDVNNIGAHCSVVVYSTAVHRDNVELVAARQRGIAVLHRADIMGWIANSQRSVAVISGTHGKTSTTSMLAEILRSTGQAPSYFIGGTPAGLATNAHYYNAGSWVVIEGDESDRSFLAFRRNLALVTNIEADHLEHWENSLDTLIQGFDDFVAGASDRALICMDDPIAAQLALRHGKSMRYGFHRDADYRLSSYTATAGGSRVTFAAPDGETVGVDLVTRGTDMATNALGAAALANLIGVEWAVAVEGLALFRGVARRFQYRATLNGADCYDDYAHTATEIATTIARANEGGWRRVIAVCQPHRYTRIARHGTEYADAFVGADHIVIAPLDPAFEVPIPGVSAQIVADAVRAAHPTVPLDVCTTWEALRDVPWRIGQPGDVIVTLGCGTITDIHSEWAEADRQRS